MQHLATLLPNTFGLSVSQPRMLSDAPIPTGPLGIRTDSLSTRFP